MVDGIDGHSSALCARTACGRRRFHLRDLRIGIVRWLRPVLCSRFSGGRFRDAGQRRTSRVGKVSSARAVRETRPERCRGSSRRCPGGSPMCACLVRLERRGVNRDGLALQTAGLDDVGAPMLGQQTGSELGARQPVTFQKSIGADRFCFPWWTSSNDRAGVCSSTAIGRSSSCGHDQVDLLVARSRNPERAPRSDSRSKCADQRQAEVSAPGDPRLRSAHHGSCVVRTGHTGLRRCLDSK